MPRFVILRHDMPVDADRPRHWDLMLEHKGSLRTWALSAEPDAGANVHLHASQLPEHRCHYLDYEGPISGNRGGVVRVDRGEYALLDETPTMITVRLEGRKTRGTAKLWRDDPSTHGWMFALTAD